MYYLAGTATYGLTYGPATFELSAYCDASYAGCLDTRRSTTGYVFILNGGAITWTSRLQPTVAVSTTEAEYMAAAAATKEALWLRKLFADLSLPIICIDIAADNQAAISLLKNPSSRCDPSTSTCCTTLPASASPAARSPSPTCPPTPWPPTR